jgi:hypothetical protein
MWFSVFEFLTYRSLDCNEQSMKWKILAIHESKCHWWIFSIRAKKLYRQLATISWRNHYYIHHVTTVIYQKSLLNGVFNNGSFKESLLNIYIAFWCFETILIIFFIKNRYQRSSQFFNKCHWSLLTTELVYNHC